MKPEGGAIHIWLAYDAEMPAQAYAQFETLLTPEEHARCERFRTEELRHLLEEQKRVTPHGDTALVDLGAKLEVPLTVETWGEDVDLSLTALLVDAAGPVVAWTG